MRRKRFAFIALALLLVLGTWVAFHTESVRPGKKTPVPLPVPAVAPGGADAPPSAAPAASLSPIDVIPQSSPRVQRSGTVKPGALPVPPDPEAMLELDRVSLMLRDYRTIAGENPVGTNAEIMEATMGKNAKQATLGPPEGMKLNEKGELLDRWGTPLFFHQLSRDHTEIRSAGPDKVMWTEDDPIIR